MTSLDRLLKLRMITIDGFESDSYVSLKSEINEVLNEHNMIFNYQGVIEKLKVALIYQKEINIKLALNMTMVRNEDDRIIALREVKIEQLKNIIKRVEDVAFDWDGKESQYYGNKIIKAIHPDWGEKKE